MSLDPKILLIDDQVGDIRWLIKLIRHLGYTTEQVTNEEAARKCLETVKAGEASYVLAIIDIMIPIKDIMDLVKLDKPFFEESKDTGIRLCRYAREELKISDEDLPIVCLSARSEDDVRKALDDLGIRLFSRTAQNPESSLRHYIKENLPQIE